MTDQTEAKRLINLLVKAERDRVLNTVMLSHADVVAICQELMKRQPAMTEAHMQVLFDQIRSRPTAASFSPLNWLQAGVVAAQTHQGIES